MEWAAEAQSVTLYWEKPEEAIPGQQYRVFVDGEITAVTDKTHVELDGLEPESEYRVRVQSDNADSKEHRICTGRQKKWLDVTGAPYYALGDGRTMNTAVLQQAMDDCGPDEAVYLPAGIFLTGALRLHSHMELYLAEGAVLQGTDCPEDYLPRIQSRFEGIEMECYSGLLNLGQLDHSGGYNCCDVVIRGKGTITSGGRVLAERVIESERIRLADDLAKLGDRILECENQDTIPGRVRPRLIHISNGQDIRICGVTLENGASWNVHMIYSDRILTYDCVFRSEGVWNGDGWDPDSSSNCTIFGCTFYTGDDAVAIKSGKNPEGNIINRPCRNIRIFDCISMFGHGITIGSEMSGGVSDVKIWDCDMSRSLCGIEIKGTKKRGGYVREIHVRDCSAPRIWIHSVLYNDDGADSGQIPVFEACCFERVHLTGVYLNGKGQQKICNAIELRGFKEPGHQLRGIVFRDVTIGNEGSGEGQRIVLENCEDVVFIGIRSGDSLWQIQQHSVGFDGK